MVRTDPPAEPHEEDTVHQKTRHPENNAEYGLGAHVARGGQKYDRRKDRLIKGPHAGEEDLGHPPFRRQRHKAKARLRSHLADDPGIDEDIDRPDYEHNEYGTGKIKGDHLLPPVSCAIAVFFRLFGRVLCQCFFQFSSQVWARPIHAVAGVSSTRSSDLVLQSARLMPCTSPGKI